MQRLLSEDDFDPETTGFRIRGTDGAGRLLLPSQQYPAEPMLTLESVPLAVSSLLIESRDGQGVLALHRHNVRVFADRRARCPEGRAPHLVKISVQPGKSSIARGTSVQLAAIGHFSDRSTQDITDIVTWRSDCPGVATVSEGGVNGYSHIYVRDTGVPLAACVLASQRNGALANYWSDLPAISDDGSWVAFASGAGKLVDGDAGASDMFVTQVGGNPARVSLTSTGQPSPADSFEVSLSRNGRWVCFYTWAGLDPRDQNDGIPDVYRARNLLIP